MDAALVHIENTKIELASKLNTNLVVITRLSGAYNANPNQADNSEKLNDD